MTTELSVLQYLYYTVLAERSRYVCGVNSTYDAGAVSSRPGLPRQDLFLKIRQAIMQAV